jgi:hypothetical protein
VKRVIEKKYDALGPVRCNEILTGIVFLLSVSLWLLRSPQFMSGWSDFLVDIFYVHNQTLLHNETKLDKSM